MPINANFRGIPSAYLFGEVNDRVRRYEAEHPDSKVLKLGVGDVTRPLAPAIIEALHKAVEEQAHAETFRGYGNEFGYDFLREAIAQGEYASIGVDVEASEVFIGDGAKTDMANAQELFTEQATVAVTDPVYPIYVDANALAGRIGTFENDRWNGLTYLDCTVENGFQAPLPKQPVEIIYLCSPNNPMGAVLTREELEEWVAYAKAHGAVILYDVAYRAFIQGDEIPRSIYEIEGADEVAIEFGSFSKTAGFTGLRCSWSVVPKKLVIDGVSLHDGWARRQATKYNGTPYIVQRAAEAVYSPEGREQIEQDIEYYRRNAKLLKEAVQNAGIEAVGGDHSPYIWFRCPGDMSSWEFFDLLLEDAQVVGTPGEGFGPAGAGYFRLSAFNSYEVTLEASKRLAEVFAKLTTREVSLER
ncbi:LL-diaminopimelate aminotransferase [Leucobacter denitrificans]|uniref:LL-diaminopimelate aminotransferase n=1 Tax=Leucobacter denitrificans TaxID=683042 RepID=A0A7G9S751_9MICO|nr:LL-diaminopimelate aminotransferase [Leucobacter denitrificans]QNN63676.1 LL-diaminopimelate aminotransferase [Leucobacter denitrificans]